MTSQNNAVATIKTSLQAMEPEFKRALPAQIPVERFIRVAQTAALTNPDILACERNSIYSSFLKAAQDGLLPDGKEAALVSFNDKKTGTKIATYMPMVAGILKKIRNSGELSTIMSQVVYKNDPFRYWVDENGEHLKHEPDMMNPERGEAVGVYAIAKTKDGSVYIEVMTREDINKVMNSSRSRDFGPWKTWPEEMSRKSVIRRLAKRLPMSTDLESVIQRDDDLYDFNNTPEEQTPKEKETPSRLNKLMKGKVAPRQDDIPIDPVEVEPLQDDQDDTV